MNVVENIFSRILPVIVLFGLTASAAQLTGGIEFQKHIKPILENYCFDCHADGVNKGNVAFDEFKTDQAMLENRELWLHALKYLRAGLMPPPKKPEPTPGEKALIEQWIKSSVFQIKPQNPDPGRITVRRLNRVEYANTIRDLIGVDFDTKMVFPPDDTGHGFDNIGDVLTLSPMLMEKYIVAANQIINQAVPMSAKVIREHILDGADFSGPENSRPKSHRRTEFPEPLPLSYYKPAVVTNTFKASLAGTYQLAVALMINEKYMDEAFDSNKCRLIFRVDGKELLRDEYGWEGGKSYTHNFELDWTAGVHNLSFELQPLTPDQPQTRSLSMQITSVKIRGPMAKEHWVQPNDYGRFFPMAVPNDTPSRQAYARELLGKFARRAFRRPPDDKTLDRLVSLAESIYSQPGKSFEAGVAQGMVAVLASPRFLFREERTENLTDGATYPFVDEFSLASRLSYFLWSSMPDEEMLSLAEAGDLRRSLTAQVQRMLKDKRSEAFVRNFVGQWLRARDIENIPIEPAAVLAREKKAGLDMRPIRRRLRELGDKPEHQLTQAERDELRTLRLPVRRPEMGPELRLAMRQETEKCFEYILREDRSLLELLDADYTFLNERLALHYDIANVNGNEMRLVKLSPDSPRGGILTQGTILGVTSNPTRTSPVKRGLFILDNILGTPPPPPPPDIPPLEAATKGFTNHTPSLRETLVAHRENPLCSSCHNRMDPLGLALENFNAMGMWRTTEFGQPIDATGSLITGETFSSVHDLKRSLVKNHSQEFFRTITEKMLIFALGRGLEYYDVETCDQIVVRMEAADGRPSALIAGVVESAPFQKTRSVHQSQPKPPAKPDQKRAAAGIKP